MTSSPRPTSSPRMVALHGFAEPTELRAALEAGGSQVSVATSPADVGDAELVLLALGPTDASLTEAAAAFPDPSRVVGYHRHRTGAANGTVEIVAGLHTAPELAARAVELAGFPDDVTAVLVKDQPGRLLDALFVPYLNDVISELDAELASAEDLDVALKLGLGYQAGPLELLDAMGLEHHLETTTALHQATGETRYGAPPLLHRMIAAGRVGGTTPGFHESSDHSAQKGTR